MRIMTSEYLFTQLKIQRYRKVAERHNKLMVSQVNYRSRTVSYSLASQSFLYLIDGMCSP